MSDTEGTGAIRSVDYIIVLCDDLGSMRRFYTDMLGFALHDEGEDWVGLQVGSLFLGLRPRGRAYDGPSPASGTASVQLSFRVPPADVDVAYRSLLDHGVSIIEQPTSQDAAWGHRTLFFRDPENNILEIYADIHPDDAGDGHSSIHDR